jgi:hypothetical protein
MVDMQADTHTINVQETLTQTRPQTIAISGASGLVGTQLIRDLQHEGYPTIRLVRRQPQSSVHEAQWDPETGLINPSRLERVWGVVHLAGENIAAGRWTELQKRRIRDSRVLGTQVLCHQLAQLEHKPRVLVCASATGFYGDRGDELVDESSPPGTGFLPEVCQAWEAATAPAVAAGIRVVNLRIGVILSKDGGALAKMLPPFVLGVGGKVGRGNQYWSWVSLPDVAGAIVHALQTDQLTGPVNAVSPQPVTNAEFTRVLGEVLHRPTVLPLPAFAARLALGQMADDLLLASVRVMPRRLLESGYRFQYGDLLTCLTHELRP